MLMEVRGWQKKKSIENSFTNLRCQKNKKTEGIRTLQTEPKRVEFGLFTRLPACLFTVTKDPAESKIVVMQEEKAPSQE